MFRYIMILFQFVTAAFLNGCNSQKQPVIQDISRTVILSPAPAAKEVTMIPVGYTTCYTVNAAFYQHMWIPAHRVCQYVNVSDNSKAIWVDGYWMCTRYDLGKGGKCNYWVWKKAHWSPISIVY